MLSSRKNWKSNFPARKSSVYLYCISRGHAVHANIVPCGEVCFLIFPVESYSASFMWLVKLTNLKCYMLYKETLHLFWWEISEVTWNFTFHLMPELMATHEVYSYWGEMATLKSNELSTQKYILWIRYGSHRLIEIIKSWFTAHQMRCHYRVENGCPNIRQRFHCTHPYSN